jgi:hypothetical protein
MALLHECKIKRYDPRHSGNCAEIIWNLAFYYHWIPDIFPDIQEKFRDDSDIIHSCNKAIPYSEFLNKLGLKSAIILSPPML